MALTEQDLHRGPGSSVDRPELVALSRLPVGHLWRSRGLAESRLVELAGSIADLPPILVRRADGVVVDGAHRVAAARRLGMHHLPVVWFEGHALDVAQAFVERNERVGLAVEAPDRESLARWVLATEPVWSDRRIAWCCGVSPKMVARHRLPAGTTGDGIERRVGRDGRARPARAGAVRERVVEALKMDPEASLRAIASRLGVSPETVRSVRHQVRSGGGVGPLGVGPVALGPPMPHPALRPVSQPWQDDRAFRSTGTGVSFVEWLDATSVLESDSGRAGEVPLSRVYEIADEARRRATFWSALAEQLESRARPARTS